MVLHQPAGVCRRSIVAVQIAPQHAQHRHLLPAMMGSMGKPPREYPSARAFHVKKSGLLLEPTLRLLAQRRQPFPTILRISFDELDAAFLGRQWRRAHVNSKHGAKPKILAHALMHHLFPHTTPATVALSRTHRQVFVVELAPDANHLYPLGFVGLN